MANSDNSKQTPTKQHPTKQKQKQQRPVPGHAQRTIDTARAKAPNEFEAALAIEVGTRRLIGAKVPVTVNGSPDWTLQFRAARKALQQIRFQDPTDTDTTVDMELE